VTKACFEPSLDYIVVKIPRWDLEKFKGVDETIGTGMKSVGEVMGIGRTFEEAYQKAIRMLDLEFEGATSEKVFANLDENRDEIIVRYLYTPTPKRMFVLPLAMRHGIAIEKIHEITGIDLWFLQRIKHIVDIEQTLQESQELSIARLLVLKQMGVSDKRIGELVGKTGLEIRGLTALALQSNLTGPR
jgi:hypothetical protein